MNHYENYKPYPIPRREQLLRNAVSPVWPPIAPKMGESDDEPFAEIEISEPRSIGGAVPVPPAQSVNLVVDEKRTLFYSMRQIAREQLDRNGDHAKAFFQQAQFMKDFEDDYAGQEPFACYYPYYQQMSYGQLRTYFSWRTQVREGNITDTSLSYAFLYIYELLNNIGVTDPEDGFDKLITFWQAFRAFNAVIDRYVLQWIKDYHVYYPLPQSFQEFASKHQLQMHYPTVFGYQSGQQDSFDLFAGISKYNIKKSIFYNEQTSQMLRECFGFLLLRLREFCGIKKRCFEDFIFCPLVNESSWTPFSRALFYPALKQADREVVISDREIYSCCNNLWTHKTVLLTENGRALIGYIMKEMEVNLRKALKFKHKLRADFDMCDRKTRKKFESMKISLPKLVQASVAEFYARYTRKEVSVDAGNLMRIREEALTTQEKLIVAEEADIREAAALTPSPSPILLRPAGYGGQGGRGEKSKLESCIVSQPTGKWEAFRAALTQTELEALTIILEPLPNEGRLNLSPCPSPMRGGEKTDIKGFAQKKGIMLEVLVDSINEKAADYIGDTVLDTGDSVTVYEEYREQLTDLLSTDFAD